MITLQVSTVFERSFVFKFGCPACLSQSYSMKHDHSQVSCVAAALPGLGWRTFFEEPAMLLGVVLLGRTLERRAKLQASSDMTALRVRACGPQWHPIKRGMAFVCMC